MRSYIALRISDLVRSAKFIGLENYISIFQDSEFLAPWALSLILTLVAVLSQFVIGMIISITFGNIHHFKKPISIMIYIPYFITAAAMGVIFRWMFMSNWGIIDQICRMIGISTPGWLDSPFWSRVVIILGEVFQNTPFSVIIYMQDFSQCRWIRLKQLKLMEPITGSYLPK